MSLLGLLLRRFTLRHWRQAPVQSAVLMLILALGIGVFFAMRLANRAVLSGFADFTGLVSQESDWVLTSPSGSLPETALREVRALLGERPVALLPVRGDHRLGTFDRRGREHLRGEARLHDHRPRPCRLDKLGHPRRSAPGAARVAYARTRRILEPPAPGTHRVGKCGSPA